MSTLTQRARRKLSKTGILSSKSYNSVYATSSVFDPPTMAGRPESPPDSVCSDDLDLSQVLSWPTGDPLNPSGFINFSFSPPPSPPLSPERCSSPVKSLRRSRSPEKSDSKAFSAISDWFQGESAPISLGVGASPGKERSNPYGTFHMSSAKLKHSSDYDCDEDVAPERPALWRRSATLTRRPASPSKWSRKEDSPSTSRFSLFGNLSSSSSAKCSTTNHAKRDIDDPILDLDIRRALETDGPPDFDTLLQKSEDLLSQLQNAYRERLIAQKEAAAEATTQQEESEEAKMRVEHLKHQLDELSTKHAEQDHAIVEMVQSLAEEKQARQAERQEWANARTVRLVEERSDDKQRLKHHEKKSSRQSLSSVASDSGFESNDESVTTADPLESPYMLSASSTTSLNSSPRLGCARRTSVTRVSASIVHTSEVARYPVRLNTAGKVETSNNRFHTSANGPEAYRESKMPGCANCGGLNSSLARGFASTLRDENLMLKERNRFLEEELDAVTGMIDALLVPGLAATE